MSSLSTRRAFIGQSLGAAALGLTAPQLPSATRSHTPKILVIIELVGGNDGLNTVVPFRDEAYWRARPNLAISAQKLLPISADLSLHPALRELAALHEKGQVAIINGVGYENSSRSHFEAMDVWHSAQLDGTEKRSGWLGRYLDAKNALGIALGNQLPLALSSTKKVASLVVSEDNQSLPTLQTLYQNHDLAAPTNFFFDVPAPGAGYYPRTELAQNLQTIAQLISNQSHTGVFYVRLGGFDTHENQLVTHANSLSTLSDTIAAFQRDLKEQGRENDVLTLTVSEFGRSVRENLMGGTDHGAANCLFIVGGRVRGGVYGDYPDLNNLENAALKPSIDFRRIYATILDKWLGSDSEKVLNGKFGDLDFV